MPSCTKCRRRRLVDDGLWPYPPYPFAYLFTTANISWAPKLNGDCGKGNNKLKRTAANTANRLRL